MLRCANGTSPARLRVARLSTREIDILSCVSLGDDNKVIARKLHIEVQTVKNHVSHILQKLGVTSRFDAARVWMDRGRHAR